VPPRGQSRRKRLRQCREFERVWIGEPAIVPLVYNDRVTCVVSR
jgi:hypothetical protein